MDFRLRRPVVWSVALTLAIGGLAFQARSSDGSWQRRHNCCPGVSTPRVLVRKRVCAGPRQACPTQVVESGLAHSDLSAAEPGSSDERPSVLLVERTVDPSRSGLFSNTRGQVAANRIEPTGSARQIRALEWHGFYHKDPHETGPIRFNIRFLEGGVAGPGPTAIYEGGSAAQVEKTGLKVDNRGPQLGRTIFKFRVEFDPPVKLRSQSVAWLAIAEDQGTHGQWLWCDAGSAGASEMSYENQYPGRVSPWVEPRSGRSSAFSLYGNVLDEQR